ncbi:tRNA-intron lyase [Candidatus Woesearchaeota archaeon]|nr:tRNA-intron lyase [Candidatus Woesearchaeota archaeon]
MSRPPAVAYLIRGSVYLQPSDEAQALYNGSAFGALSPDGRLDLSGIEALYLLEKKRITLLDSRRKEASFDQLLRKVKRDEPGLWPRYCVLRDLRDRGYTVKTALKFGADFRVYDRGVKPGKGHAKWVVYPVKEGSSFSWYEFAAKNRVAHSTKKRLLIAVVDDESDVTYYEIRWLRP